ncbi:isocitrate lyase [Fusarium heterosporum]|uniref:Isocitrate lyase n=1 Tax=Fusarium heterosporum TaxID=42747 RepID=A0A8H5T1I7_FUSHE|nr:isocitrate lyase [Fusarium heterosporum]
MVAKWDSSDAESEAFLSEVQQIQAWWQTDRQKGIKRPYSAESIAALRNIGFKIQYPSSVQGLKLWHMLKDHHANGTYELTFGTTDPLVAKDMATSMSTVYVSGGLAGYAMANYPGDDHADYPADLVPSIVRRIFNTQLYQDQSQTQLRMKYSVQERKRLECIDYMLPIVADADMGFGTLTGCMKLVRNFVESGVAMIHIDDLAMGLKKFTNGEGRTIVPTSEYLTRLTAVRMTYDIMGCDGHGAEFITRDHPYVLGATKTVTSFSETMSEAARVGKPYAVAKTEWKNAAGLMTFDQAVQALATEDQYRSYQEGLAGQTMALGERRRLAERLLGQTVAFDWELPRTSLGQYMWQWSSKAVIERCLVAAPLGDMSWSRQDKKEMEEFHSAIRQVYPDRMFAFGFTGSYDFSKGGYTPDEIGSFHSDIAKMGVVWQFQPVWAMQGPSVQNREFAAKFAKGGMSYYMREVAAPAIASLPTDSKGNAISRAGHLADAFFDVVAGRDIVCPE